jgi:hypothetical protein
MWSLALWLWGCAPGGEALHGSAQHRRAVGFDLQVCQPAHMVRGHDARWEIWGAEPGETLVFGMGTEVRGDDGPVVPSLGDLRLNIAHAWTVAEVTADAAGRAVVQVEVPGHARSGLTTYAQAVALRGEASVKSHVSRNVVIDDPAVSRGACGALNLCDADACCDDQDDDGVCDAADACPVHAGELRDCDGRCASEVRLADGRCDATLDCAATGFDGGDCLDCADADLDGLCDDIDSCPEHTGEELDCSGACIDAGLLGDGWCDDRLDCAEAAHDAGDCAPFGCGPDEVSDCLGGCAPSRWVADGVCDLALACPETGMDGGDCGEHCLDHDLDGICSDVDVCPHVPGELVDCAGDCADPAALGDGHCDAALSCDALGADAGDCTCADEDADGLCDAVDPCPVTPGALVDCAGRCIEAPHLGDGLCDAPLDCPALEADQGDCAPLPGCHLDADEDGLCDASDVCPLHYGAAMDCAGACVDASWLADGWCDASLSCQLGDGGDCAEQPDLHNITVWLTVDSWPEEAGWALHVDGGLWDTGAFTAPGEGGFRQLLLEPHQEVCVALSDTLGDGGIAGFVRDETTRTDRVRWTAAAYTEERTLCVLAGG